MSQLVKGLVEEKQSRVKETMKIMGLSDFVYNAAWFTIAGCQWLLSSALCTLVVWGLLLDHTDGSIVFVYFVVFSMSEIALCFLLAALFNRALLAAILAPIALLALAMLRFIVWSTPTWELIWAKWLLSIIAPSAFVFGGDSIASFEAMSLGMGWDEVDVGPFPFSASLIMMVVDALIYFVLAWYLDKVLPKTFGVQYPACFPCSRQFWKNYCFNLRDHLQNVNTDATQSVDDEGGPAVSRAVVISHLRKIFRVRGHTPCSHEDKVAVADLSLEAYKDQITVLLGHNGAGKSTTMSILAGLISATAGDCEIQGLSISRDMPRIRTFLGMCPQHNVLFPKLTVNDHLRFFAVLKRAVPTKSKNNVDPVALVVDSALREVGLFEKKGAIATTLSGGQKRKLSLAIALLGNSSVVFLDEPTSGMDP